MRWLVSVVLLLALFSVAYADTGIQFPTNAATGDSNSSSPRFKWVDPHLNGLPIYGTAGQGVTYIWRYYPEQQTGYYTTFFYACDDGGGTLSTFFACNDAYYGAHPYPPSGSGGSAHEWEISVESDDYTNGTVVKAQWYTQALVVWEDGSGNKHHEFYWDLPNVDAGSKVSRTSPSSYGENVPSNVALTWGDAPWQPGRELGHGIYRGIRIYSIQLSENDVLSESVNPLSTVSGADNIWYLNMNPTPTDIADDSGNGNDPEWVSAARPALWNAPGCSTTAYGNNNLERAANGLAAGESCTLETSTGLTQSTFQVTSHNVTTQTYKALWDSVNKELRWVGQEQGNSGTPGQNLSLHIKYDATTDAWSNTLTSPVGDLEAGHGNDQNAINPSTGAQYRRPYGSNTPLVYNYAGDSWSAIDTIGGSAPLNCSSITWHDSRDTLVSVHKDRGIHEWNGSSWSQTIPGTLANMGGDICPWSAYDSVNDRLLYGVESNFNEFTNAGTVATLTAPPVTINVFSNDTVATDPVSGDLIVAGGSSTWYYFRASDDTWQTLSDMPVVGPTEAGGHYTTATAIPDYGVIGIVDCNGDTCPAPRFIIYKHSAFQSVPQCQDSLDNDGDGMIDLLDPSCADADDTDEDSPGSDFETECKDASVVRCYAFEDETDITTGHPALLTQPDTGYPNGNCDAPCYSRVWEPWGGIGNCTLQGSTTCWDLDTSIKYGGKSALTFQVPSNSGSDSSGAFHLNFTDDFSTLFGEGEEFYVRYRYRVSADMNRHFAAVGGGNADGFKSMIVGAGDTVGNPQESSCTTPEVVFQTDSDAPYLGPYMYHRCPGSGGSMRFTETDTLCDPDQIRNQLTPYPSCCYNQWTDCELWIDDGWVQLQMHVSIGTWGVGGGSSRVRGWMESTQGKRLIYDTAIADGSTFAAGGLQRDAGQEYGKLWLLPYNSNKSSAESHNVGYVWYDNLIISTTDLWSAGVEGSIIGGSITGGSIE